MKIKNCDLQTKDWFAAIIKWTNRTKCYGIVITLDGKTQIAHQRQIGDAEFLSLPAGTLVWISLDRNGVTDVVAVEDGDDLADEDRAALIALYDKSQGVRFKRMESPTHRKSFQEQFVASGGRLMKNRWED